MKVNPEDLSHLSRRIGGLFVTLVRLDICLHIVLFALCVCFFPTYTFQLLDKPSSQMSYPRLPGFCLQCLQRIGFSKLLLVIVSIGCR